MIFCQATAAMTVCLVPVAVTCWKVATAMIVWWAGAGSDLLTGGAGADVFRFGYPGQFHDHVTDFQRGTDLLVFQTYLVGLGVLPGALDPTYFATNAATATHGQFVFYDQSSSAPGELRWDADGTGQSFGLAIAVLDGVTSLSAADFWLI